MKVKSTTCRCCGGYANWDSSFGYPEFIVCCDCFEDMVQYVVNSRKVSLGTAREKVMSSIFTFGIVAKKRGVETE